MSTSGVAAAHLHRAPSGEHDADPRPARPIVFGDPQPQLGASLIASNTAAMPTDISVAAVQLMRPGALTGDSGTNSPVATAATTAATSGTQNSQW